MTVITRFLLLGQRYVSFGMAMDDVDPGQGGRGDFFDHMCEEQEALMDDVHACIKKAEEEGSEAHASSFEGVVEKHTDGIMNEIAALRNLTQELHTAVMHLTQQIDSMQCRMDSATEIVPSRKPSIASEHKITRSKIPAKRPQAQMAVVQDRAGSDSRIAPSRVQNVSAESKMKREQASANRSANYSTGSPGKRIKASAASKPATAKTPWPNTTCAYPLHGKSEEPDTRTVFSLYEKRVRDKAQFQAVIQNPTVVSDLPDDVAHKSSGVNVYVRIRPMFKSENTDQFAVVFKKDREVTLKNCNYKSDTSQGREVPKVTTQRFVFDEVFDPADNIDVYTNALAGQVHYALNGDLGCTMMYGQTGSGKTFTMTALTEFAAQDIFKHQAKTVKLSYLELKGNDVKNLIGTKAMDVNWKVATSKVFLENLDSVEVGSAQELLTALTGCQMRRATKATQKNAVSSRSHAVAILEFSNGGKLMLWDLAGSERNQDTLFHQAEDIATSTYINQSYYYLKEIMRSKREGKTPIAKDFAQNSLTAILSEVFIEPNAKRARGHQWRTDTHIALIATVSPSAADTEHTLTTLKTAFAFSGRIDNQKDSYMEITKLGGVGSNEVIDLRFEGDQKVEEESQLARAAPAPREGQPSSPRSVRRRLRSPERHHRPA